MNKNATLSKNEKKAILVIVDINIKDEYSFELISKFAKCGFTCIVYSMYESLFFAITAFENGACGYCFKSEPLENLVLAMDMCVEGKQYVPQSVSTNFICASSLYSAFTKKE